jgi:hypothetical protein
MSLRSYASRKHLVSPSFMPAHAAGKPLDSVDRAAMEARFRHDFSQVRVHADANAQRSADHIGAAAYTTGADVVFGAGSYDRGRLAHELTHVVQQAGGNASSSAEALETEAQQNSERIALGFPAHVHGGASPGMVQCQEKGHEKEKPEGTFTESSGPTLKPGSVKNKFDFTAEMSIPLFQNTKKAPISFLNKLELKESGSNESEKFLPGPADIHALQTEAALTVMGLDVPKLLQGRMGTLGLGGKVGATGNVTLDDQKKPTGAFGGTASTDLSFKSLSLIPGYPGSLILSGKLGATGSIEQSSGPDDKFKAKAGANVTAGAEYKSRKFGGPGATFFGLLGDKATFSFASEGKISGAAETDKHPSATIGVSETFGLTGAGKDERFIKIKVSGNAALDLNKGGTIDPASRVANIEISLGFKFH